MKKNFIANIGDLVDIQHVSYYNFLLKGLESELSSLKNGKSFLDSQFLNKDFLYKFYFFSKNAKFRFPAKNFLEFKKGDGTYSIRIYLPVFYSCKNIYNITNDLDSDFDPTEELKKKISNSSISKEKMKTIYCTGDVFLCEIPLMTQEGTFLITGCERILISQIIRAPGLYFRREKNSSRSKKILCTATLISDKGLWTKFKLNYNSNNKLKIELNATSFGQDFSNRIKTISLMSLLAFFNISLDEIISCLNPTERTQFYTKFDLVEEEVTDNLKNYLYSTFYNIQSGCFSIGTSGRLNLNQSFKQDIPLSVTYLCGIDFISILKRLINLRFFGLANDDIDHIKNKQVRPAGSILQNKFRIGFISAAFKFSAALKDKAPFSLHKKYLPSTLDNLSYKYTSKIWSEFLTFFKLSEISQYMDQTNILSEMSHKRRLTVFGPNGLNRDNVSDIIRDIHPSQYAKFCPVETPEGETAGLVSSLSFFARYNKLGYIEMPCSEIKKGSNILSQPAVYLNAKLESKTSFAFSDTAVGIPNSKLTDANLHTKQNAFFSTSNKNVINFITLSPVQLLSLATNLVPFIEHNDANRGLMGANMQRQSMPLLYSQKPLVGTGFESNILWGSEMILNSYTEGQVSFLTSNAIYINDRKKQKLKYFLKKYFNSNQDTFLNQQSCVWIGEKVFSNQIIAESGGALDGELALGKNLTIAYMPWDGYNFEDAIIINEKLLSTNVLTSIIIQELETTLNNDFFENIKIANSLKTKIIIDYLLKLNTTPFDFIITLLKYFVSNNNFALFSKQLLKDLIFYLDGNESALVKKDLTIFLTKNIRYANKLFQSQNIKKYLNNQNPTEANLSDKDNTYLAQFHLSQYETKNLNYYGIIKKGTYVFPNDVLIAKAKIQKENLVGQSKLLKALSRTVTPQEVRDVSYRVPHSITGRVIDLRFFAERTFLTKDPATRYFESEKIKIFIAETRLLEIGDKLAGRHGNKGVISKIVSQQDMPFLPDGTPIDIIFNPLGVPSRMNVGQLFESLLGFAGFHLGLRFKVTPFDEIFGTDSSRILISQKLKEARLKTGKKWVYSSIFPGKILLRDGRTGDFFDNPIFVGKSYILKLIHLVNDKIHARSIGPYAMITEQPLAGKSLEGGQRFGEMETWALEGFGCSMLLNELFTVKADDIDARNFFYQAKTSELLTRSSDSFLGETFLTLIRELNALGLELAPQKISKENFTLKKIDFFKTIEKKLKLNALIDKAKVTHSKKNILAIIKKKKKKKKIK